MTQPVVSVIIPTYRDWPRLRSCLGALRAQTLSPADFEIVVVDNDDEPQPLDKRPAGVTYVHEPEGFSYTARNSGLRYARGGVIAFTDADCLPVPDWLEQGLKRLRELPQCSLLGGRIEMFAEEQTLPALYDFAYGLNQEMYFKIWGGFATANVFLRREVFDCIGGFDTRLESWGDFEYCQRAAEAGFGLAYAPLAVIRHPARGTIAEQLRKNSRVARGLVTYNQRHGRYGRMQLVSKIVWLFRPRLRDWYYTLRGGRGSEVLPWQRRPGILMLRIFIHYQFAWAHFLAAVKNRRAAAAGTS